MTFRGLPYHGRDGVTVTTAWPAPTLPHGRHGHGDPGDPAPHMDHDVGSSSVRGPADDAPPAARTPAARLRSLVEEFRVLKQAAGDNFRRRCQILFEIKGAGLWEGQGCPSFDVWAWRTLRLDREAVRRMLGIAAGPIGGPGRRGGRPVGGATRARAGGQMGEVEGLETPQPPRGAHSAAVEWVERTVASFRRAGPEGLLAGAPEADRARLVRGLIELEAVVRDHRQALQATARATAQRGGNVDA